MKAAQINFEQKKKKIRERRREVPYLAELASQHYLETIQARRVQVVLVYLEVEEVSKYRT